MYEWSRYTGVAGVGLIGYSIKDSCFGTINVAIRPPVYSTSIETLEACAVFQEYSRRNLNVSLNMAAYFTVRAKRGFGSNKTNIMYWAPRILDDSWRTLDRDMPGVSFGKKYYRSIRRYIVDFNTKFALPKSDQNH